MSYKTICVSLEAYKRLKAFQLLNESFSEEILRFFRKKKFSDVAGILSEEEAKQLEEGVREVKKNWVVQEWQ